MNKPRIILFSFLSSNKCIGYGGFVHIDWKKYSAELSFILDTKRIKNIKKYEKEFIIFLKLILKLNKEQIEFLKCMTTENREQLGEESKKYPYFLKFDFHHI